MEDKRILVVGAGIGGIAAAARLARSGYQVQVFEKNAIPGGRCGQMEIQGHRFDTGPTLFLMPELYQGAFKDLGEQIHDHLTLKRVDPTYQIHFNDGVSLALSSDLNTMYTQLDSAVPRVSCATWKRDAGIMILPYRTWLGVISGHRHHSST